MRYVYVGGKPPGGNKVDYNEDAIRHAKYCLVSIIRGLSQKDFGAHTMFQTKKDIQWYKGRYIDPINAHLYIDSGGYSIIVGDIHPDNTYKAIGFYNDYLENERDVYDSIFSLDIPIYLQYPEHNTKAKIYEYNLKSLSESKVVLERHPELRSKFHFVWQFKVKGQYEIWKHLYESLGYSKLVNNYAIGGMVGLRGMLKNGEDTEGIDFSPFIALAYRSLLDYIHTEQFGELFRLHNLGIYIKHDRFELFLLEKLFNRYLQEYGASSLVSYDSINYMRTAHFKVKELDTYQVVNEDIIRYSNILEVPIDRILEIYGQDRNDIVLEYEKLRSGLPLTNIDAFVPLNIHSNMEMDQFIEYAIDKYGIVDMFFQARSYEHFVSLLKQIDFWTIKWPALFTSRFMYCIKENMRISYIFHKWFMQKRDYASLDVLINQFIDKIGFPATLE